MYSCEGCGGQHRYADQVEQCRHEVAYAQARTGGADPADAFQQAQSLLQSG